MIKKNVMKTVLFCMVCLLAFSLTACLGDIPTGTYYKYENDEKVSGYSVTVSIGLNGNGSVNISTPSGNKSYQLKDGKLYDGGEESVGSISYSRGSKTLNVSSPIGGGNLKK